MSCVSARQLRHTTETIGLLRARWDGTLFARGVGGWAGAGVSGEYGGEVARERVRMNERTRASERASQSRAAVRERGGGGGVSE